MSQIRVQELSETVYEVTVTDSGTSTTHEVTVSPDSLERFGEGAPAERLLEASFRFLLEREPKEAILRRFDLPVIARYFPEYPEVLPRYLE